MEHNTLPTRDQTYINPPVPHPVSHVPSRTCIFTQPRPQYISTTIPIHQRHTPTATLPLHTLTTHASLPPSQKIRPMPNARAPSMHTPSIHRLPPAEPYCGLVCMCIHIYAGRLMVFSYAYGWMDGWINSCYIHIYPCLHSN